MDVPRHSSAYEWAKASGLFSAGEDAARISVWIFAISLVLWAWETVETRSRWPLNTDSLGDALETASPGAYAFIVGTFALAVYAGNQLRVTATTAVSESLERSVEVATVRDPKKRMVS